MSGKQVKEVSTTGGSSFGGLKMGGASSFGTSKMGGSSAFKSKFFDK